MKNSIADLTDDEVAEKLRHFQDEARKAKSEEEKGAAELCVSLYEIEMHGRQRRREKLKRHIREIRDIEREIELEDMD